MVEENLRHHADKLRMVTFDIAGWKSALAKVVGLGNNARLEIVQKVKV